ncbi:hypothetical protein BC834DRAFT_816242 [Gloeopeniophorella convolvens]|nr:hypothetical protein BC834DRAFT_816242 [Gloeopeniophorella convolvens]
MPWWLPSWLSLPTFDVSVFPNLQRKFFSFILKKSLGHLLQPGQLDIEQIDSAVGSGNLTINDLKLEPTSINALLSGSPIQLHEGCIASIAARIPWPNPLANGVELSVNSLDLTFHLSPQAAEDIAFTPSNLAESISDAAQLFVHEEVTHEESTQVYQAAHLGEASQPDLDHDYVPGGLNAFSTEDQEVSPDMDPAGISMFASMIEYLISQFTFSARDIRITMVNPGQSSFRFKVSELRYGRPTTGDGGSTRAVQISGIEVAHRDLGVWEPYVSISDGRGGGEASSIAASLSTHVPASVEVDQEYPSDSMSQSIADLRSGSSSPSASVSSSLFQSAVSMQPMAGEHDDRTTATPVLDAAGAASAAFSKLTEDHHAPYGLVGEEEHRPHFETILSLASEPIVVQITTSPQSDLLQPNLGVSVSIGVIACTLTATQVCAIMDIVSAIGTHTNKGTQPPPPEQASAVIPALSLLDQASFTVHIRGFVVLVPSATQNSLDDFFAHPLIPPKTSFSYARVVVDTLRADCSVSRAKTLTCSFSVADLSACAFCVPFGDVAAVPVEPEMFVLPIILTDSHLSGQYLPEHQHPPIVTQYSDISQEMAHRVLPPIPEFDVLDWTSKSHRTSHARLTSWRVKPPQGHRSLHQTTAFSAYVSMSSFRRPEKDSSQGSKYSLDVNFIPLHVFLDLERSQAVIDFLEVLANHSAIPNLDTTSSSSSSSYFHGTIPDGDRRPSREDEASRDGEMEFNVDFSMIRIQLRCPSPPSHSQRSGAMILDVHDLKLTNRTRRGTTEGILDRLGPPLEPTRQDLGPSQPHLLSAEWRALLLAYSPAEKDTAKGFCSIGPLSSDTDEEGAASPEHVRFPDEAIPTRQPPRLRLTKASSGRSGGSTTTLISEVDIPSVSLNISKPLFDDLQFWADDISQLLERISTATGGGSQEQPSANPSLVGSRFFSRSKQSTVLGKARQPAPLMRTCLLYSVFVRLLVPRQIDQGPPLVKSFDILASDIDLLFESKPEGRDESVVTLSVMRAAVLDAASSIPLPMLLLTPHNLLSSAKPLAKLRFSSVVLPETASKESRIKLTLCGFTFNFFPDLNWVDSLIAFARPPPGVFESVVPSERTQVAVSIVDGSIRLFTPKSNGAFVLQLGDVNLSTDIVGNSSEMELRVAVHSLATLFTDQHAETSSDRSPRGQQISQGASYWKSVGFALVSEVSDLALVFRRSNISHTKSEVTVDRVTVRVHLCADTGSALGLFFGDFGAAFAPNTSRSENHALKRPAVVSAGQGSSDQLAYSIDQLAFRTLPEIGPAPDMINDDLPSNADYLDASFGAAAGLRELDEEDLDMDDHDQTELMGDLHSPDKTFVSSSGGETIKVLHQEGLRPVANFFNTLPALAEDSPQLAEYVDRILIREGDVTLFLYEGFDWMSTRRTIEEEVKKLRRRLIRIKQLVASGQTYDPSDDPTSTLLFNSIHVGLDQDAEEMEPEALLAAIDDQLKEEAETASVSSWQSLKPTSPGKPSVPRPKHHSRRLTRARSPSIEFRLSGLFADVVTYVPNDEFVSRTFATVKDVEILDHVKTSTWRKFLSALRSDSRGNIRETGSNMVRIELRSVHPVPGNASEETRLRAMILPLRLHVDQDALDFLKKFFTFQDPNLPQTTEPRNETYLQRAEVFPVGLKLDYKPRRVDYRALRDGKTIELMNFFHFDGAEMTLRHITLFGVAGWPKFFDMLNDLWTPDVKATQLADVISGVSPIRSVVNVGSGVADLVLLPIAQYRKDGRVVRGLQKGTKSFVRSTAMEAVKLGAQLATGTQVILEQTENVLGSKFNETVLAEAVSQLPEDDTEIGRVNDWAADEDTLDPISRYADQPVDVREGIQSAYTSMRRNLSSAAQTILAVPMEVFERSGSEGPVRAVIRAVPIAVLRPMIGASEAVSKALLGLQNTMDPDIRHENAVKYKQR